MASSDSHIDKTQRGRPKRAELPDVNQNKSAQSINTERDYDFVACNLLTTRLRHCLGHDYCKVLKLVLKSYNFFRVVKEVACDIIASRK